MSPANGGTRAFRMVEAMQPPVGVAWKGGPPMFALVTRPVGEYVMVTTATPLGSPGLRHDDACAAAASRAARAAAESNGSVPTLPAGSYVGVLVGFVAAIGGAVGALVGFAVATEVGVAAGVVVGRAVGVVAASAGAAVGAGGAGVALAAAAGADADGAAALSVLAGSALTVGSAVSAGAAGVGAGVAGTAGCDSSGAARDVRCRRSRSKNAAAPMPVSASSHTSARFLRCFLS